ncbi:MAG: helix-turn-helix transcriptional regulator [Proteobacteria bacterium]|nr:helix-turn-helix transcriptional regulator [Pseudomonadota bacterium]
MGGKKPWDRKRLKLQQMLRAARSSAELKQADLAKRLSADQSFVSRYERENAVWTWWSYWRYVKPAA